MSQDGEGFLVAAGMAVGRAFVSVFIDESGNAYVTDVHEYEHSPAGAVIHGAVIGRRVSDDRDCYGVGYVDEDGLIRIAELDSSLLVCPKQLFDRDFELEKKEPEWLNLSSSAPVAEHPEWIDRSYSGPVVGVMF